MRKLLIFVSVALIVSLAPAATPRFTGPEFVDSAGVPIDVGYYGAPTMYDWTSDGAKDLIVGQYDSGKVRLYPNIGLDTAPEFEGYEFFKVAGMEITLPYG
jgi:hypothetical protein